ncbi:YIP1 family protein [Halobiforma nitratireducens]|uniref:Yip1 domain-containing protein n=1 Tax=Halobiforma nitratireducens JCM 10879 TaxID=1227454 RepID=M0LZN1_9EURY|nr:YIP1 family protein [Halobiforma nitratireducens]EMA37839.1 hypothetical protein C446_10450 [Halobiforma nitratireducens JCM 10879]
MPSGLRSLQTFLRRPSVFFDEYPPATTLPVAAGVVVVYAATLAASVLVLGSMLEAAFDAAVTVDNPDRPPEWVCEQHGDSESPVASGCDEPETVEASSLVQDAILDFLPYVVVTPFALWVVGGIVLLTAGRIAAGTPSFRGTLSLAGWAVIPEFVRLAVVIVAFRYALEDVTISDSERAPDVIGSAAASIDPVLALAAVGTAAWQWWLLTGGLEEDAELSRRAAAVAAGVPLGIFLLLSL